MNRRKKLVWLLVGSWLAVGFVSVAQADLADAEAAFELGDYDTAFKEFKPLAEQGDAGAQYYLGFMYYLARGVPWNYEQALKWSRMAAEQGFADAQFMLGTMYDDGDGVSQDYKEALNWFRKAADQGHALAQYELGYAYATGEGVPQDYLFAHMWLNLAASQGDERAIKARDDVAEKMTREQTAEAQKLAREWKPKE